MAKDLTNACFKNILWFICVFALFFILWVYINTTTWGVAMSYINQIGRIQSNDTASPGMTGQTSVSNSTAQLGWPGNSDEERTSPQPPLTPDPTVQKVIIYSKYRSGSTFASQFVFKQQSTWFMFEPLYLTPYRHVVTDGQGILWDLLRCNFTGPPVDRINRNWFQNAVFCQLKGQTPGCIPGQPRSMTDNEALCLNTSTRAVKVVRLRNLLDLEDFIHAGVKVVQVIRDPRGVAASRLPLHQPPDLNSNVTWIGENFCRHAMEDLRYRDEVIRPDPALSSRYLLLRYEDLARHPVEQMNALYQFLNLQPDTNVRSWAEQVAMTSRSGTTKPSGSVNAFRTDRGNSAYTAHAWRHRLQLEQVQQVQKNCREFMKAVGYVPVDSEHQLQNGSIDLLSSLPNTSYS